MNDIAQDGRLAPGVVEGLQHLFDEYGALGVQRALVILAPEATAAFLTGDVARELERRAEPEPITRLFGQPDAEHMDLDIGSTYERHADDYCDEPVPDITIEEWTVSDPRVPMAQAEMAAENIAENMSEEGDEDYGEQWMNAAGAPDVVAAFQAACDLMASKITYRMADKLVATHVITHDADGEPMLDGERLYRKAGE